MYSGVHSSVNSHQSHFANTNSVELTVLFICGSVVGIIIVSFITVPHLLFLPSCYPRNNSPLTPFTCWYNAT
ncbi:hypothetical protein HanXRQr2_Chr13g0594821 [Helianthus annuus]|uniref:Uncharacterized protein n=1 Tax=Helianthus annuus TaxID=4232 RepID=A0A9K3HCG3_HELAN|nr:hypothetical protein HanXRQr2_Chr13g0594821 [Helianthus annuus]KAJ0849778.1 hypothetical protein HanPSC8_Chr13g0572861 [Helianthus annuus]